MVTPLERVVRSLNPSGYQVIDPSHEITFTRGGVDYVLRNELNSINWILEVLSGIDQGLRTYIRTDSIPCLKEIEAEMEWFNHFGNCWDTEWEEPDFVDYCENEFLYGDGDF